ncbi:MAG: hypothetical protein AAF481_02360 [Acidobacteriota bacterium]
MRPFDVLLLPLRDVLRGQQHTLTGYGSLGLMALGLIAGWLVYVPLHELLHAYGCLLAGGEVTRLEIDTLYGGALLARIIPFVVAGSEYAGRLSGFDTGGSDLVYLATDLAPFVLTLLPGVWALRRAARAGRALLFGASLPFALAPFLSLTGDAYEIGSILVTAVGPWSASSELLRGDDVALVAGVLPADGFLWAGYVGALSLGALWAFATYALGAAVARALGQKAMEAVGAKAAPPAGS